MTSQTTAGFEKLFSVTGVALLLRGQLVIKALLPEIGGDRLNLLLAVLVAHVQACAFVRFGETPEGRHLGAGTERLRIFKPDRNPLFAQLDADVFEIWSNLLLVLHQISRLQLQLIDTCGQQTVRDAETFSVGQKLRHLGYVLDCLRSFGVGARLFVIREDLIFKLSDLLACVGQDVCFAIETLIAMTTLATAL